MEELKDGTITTLDGTILTVLGIVDGMLIARSDDGKIWLYHNPYTCWTEVSIAPVEHESESRADTTTYDEIHSRVEELKLLQGAQV